VCVREIFHQQFGRLATLFDRLKEIVTFMMNDVHSFSVRISYFYVNLLICNTRVNVYEIAEIAFLTLSAKSVLFEEL